MLTTIHQQIASSQLWITCKCQGCKTIICIPTHKPNSNNRIRCNLIHLVMLQHNRLNNKVQAFNQTRWELKDFNQIQWVWITWEWDKIWINLWEVVWIWEWELLIQEQWEWVAKWVECKVWIHLEALVCNSRIRWQEVWECLVEWAWEWIWEAVWLTNRNMVIKLNQQCPHS